MRSEQLLYITFSSLIGLFVSSILSTIIYSYYFDYGSIGIFFLLPFGLFLFLIFLCLCFYADFKKWAYPYAGIWICLGATILLSSIQITHKTILDSPRILLKATFFNESGFDLYLREDWTVKATEIDMISSRDKYGTYQRIGDTIVLKDITINYGFSTVQDTLIVTDQVLFRLDKEWRGVLEAGMHIERNDFR
ncbi:MAG: hypothetical protein AAF840_09410 [Bacteroidota bacterium]